MPKRTVPGKGLDLFNATLSADKSRVGGTTGPGDMGPNRIHSGGRFDKPPKNTVVTGPAPVVGGAPAKGPMKGGQKLTGAPGSFPNRVR